MRTFWRFGLKRRRVATIEWLREFPNAGPFPQLKQTLAMRTVDGSRVVAGRSGGWDAEVVGVRPRGRALTDPDLAHPGHGLGNSLLQRHLRVVTQVASRPLDVG